MKEIIAQRDKSFFLLVTVVGIISLTVCIIALIFIPRFLWLYICGISIMGFITLIGIIGLCFPNWVIVKETNTVIIQNGFRGLKKMTLNITDIIDAKVYMSPQQTKPQQNGNIILTVTNKNAHAKEIVINNVKNTSHVVEKIKSIIQK